MYNAYLKFTSMLTKIISYIAMICLISMVVTCFAQVVIRNMGQSAPWVEELARYSQVWTTFLGGAVAYKHGSLAAIDFVKDRLRKNAKAVAVLEIAIWVLSVFFFYYLISGGFVLVSKMARQLTPALKISKIYVYSALPIGGCFMLLFSFEHLIDSILILMGKKEDKK